MRAERQSTQSIEESSHRPFPTSTRESETSLVIAGVGCVTPLGVGLDATWHALLDGQFLIEPGHVPIARDRRPRVEQIALLAAREAIADADVRNAILYVGTSKGPADQWLADDDAGLFGLATFAESLACDLRIFGDRRTFSAACASGLHALAGAAFRMRHDGVDRAVVVAAESSMNGIWSQTFKRLGVLARPGEPCRPFDEGRHGFRIAEAAAAVVLERRDPRPGDVVVDAALFGGDAHHLTGHDPDAGLLRHLIARVAGDAPVDFAHAHATATGNDPIELAAIEATLGRHRPLVYSHKGAIGHTLGASGLVALAISHRCHKANVTPPHATTSRPIATTLPLAGPAVGRDRDIRRSVVLASGFGGATAAVALRRIE